LNDTRDGRDCIAASPAPSMPRGLKTKRHHSVPRFSSKQVIRLAACAASRPPFRASQTSSSRLMATQVRQSPRCKASH